MIPVVLDTNILISALIVPVGKPAQILARLNHLQLITTEEILAEVNRALHYPRIQRKYGISEDTIQAYLARIREVSTIINPITQGVTMSRDPDDNKFLACAKDGKAYYVVSGDPHLLDIAEWQGIRILTPAAFLTLLVSLSPD